jgi:ATP-dependent DNA ligase
MLITSDTTIDFWAGFDKEAKKRMPSARGPHHFHRRLDKLIDHNSKNEAKKPIRIIYRKLSGSMVKRKIDPMSMKGNTLVAYDHRRKAIRSFRMERVKELMKVAFLEKRHYTKTNISDLDPNKPNEIWTAKIDGAHSIVQMERGKLPRLFSHRISKKTGEPIEYTQKLPNIKTPSQFNGIYRAEVYAVGKDGKAVHPDIVSAMLTRGVERSHELQKELGLRTRVALIDVDRHEGEDISWGPFQGKREILQQIVKRSKDFVLPDTAKTPGKKKSLLSRILSGLHRQTKEGIVVHDLESSEKPFSKAKIVDHHDVYVTGIFQEEGTKPGRKPMAGGFMYSWDISGKPVGKVGTGFDHTMKEDMLKNPQDYIGRVAKVKALDVSKNKILVKPSFDGWHVEKNL